MCRCSRMRSEIATTSLRRTHPSLPDRIRTGNSNSRKPIDLHRSDGRCNNHSNRHPLRPPVAYQIIRSHSESRMAPGSITHVTATVPCASTWHANASRKSQFRESLSTAAAHLTPQAALPSQIVPFRTVHWRHPAPPQTSSLPGFL